MLGILYLLPSEQAAVASSQRQVDLIREKRLDRDERDFDCRGIYRATDVAVFRDQISWCLTGK